MQIKHKTRWGMPLINPHGGKLVNRVLSGKEREEELEKSKSYKSLKVNYDTATDINNIALGVFSPLEGFMTRKDFESVLENSTLMSGVVWTIPIVLPIKREYAEKLSVGEKISLIHDDKIIAVLSVEDVFKHDRERHAKLLYGTLDKNHPGVKWVLNQEEYLVGGKIQLLNRIDVEMQDYFIPPKETREIFGKMGWETVVGFHTRNPPHRAHEFLQKTALEIVDGLFIQPIIGTKKPGDFKTEAIIRGYEELINSWHVKDRVVLGTWPSIARYGGPKEAVLTAIVRQNFGCSHFIVGRDHTGVGKFYGVYDSHKIFDELPHKLDINILKFREPHYCKICKEIVTEKTCPHEEKDKIYISGRMIRRSILTGDPVPGEIMRPEVSKSLTLNDLIPSQTPYTKTRIITTIGPSSWNAAVLSNIIETGVYCVRINSAHSNIEELRRLVETIHGISEDVKILVDLPGKKIRVLNLSEPLRVGRGDIIRLSNSSDSPGAGKVIQISNHYVIDNLRENNHFYIGDSVQCEVLKKDDNVIVSKVLSDGVVRPNIGLFFPDIDVKESETISSWDLEVISKLNEMKVDYIGLSYVRSAKDVANVKKLTNGNIKIISKIETKDAITNLDEIINESDMIMIDRGDLASEMGFEQIPYLQNKIIKRCKTLNKQVIVATEMLLSMLDKPTPSKAEVTDVSNAAFQGADALMLSEETAIGKYPVETVQVMKKIIQQAESLL